MIAAVATKMSRLIFNTEKKFDTTKSNEIIEFIQNSQEFIRDLVRGKGTIFNRYSDRLKALTCLTKCKVEETALADAATIESNRPEYGNGNTMMSLDSDLCLRL